MKMIKGTITEFNPDYIISDPRLRISIEQFSPNIRDEIRRAFMERGPTQSSSHVFPREDKMRFRKEWFEKYNWLEYSLVNGKAYCFCCYLFRWWCILSGRYLKELILNLSRRLFRRKKIEICNYQSLLDATNNKYTGITLYSNCVSCITFNILTLIFRY